MRGLRHLVAAVILTGATACGTNGEDSRVIGPETPESSQDDTGADPVPEAVSLLLASREGVHLIGTSSEPLRLSHRPAAVAYGVRDDVVVFQGSDSDMDLYPPPPVGPVEMWSDGTVRELPRAPGATSVLLLDAALVDGRPSALVAERFGEGDPETAAEELVLIDLEDLTRRTVAARQPAWESGHQAARLRPDGDIIGLHQQGVQVHLVRWSSEDGTRAWSVKVAEDRAVSLAASDAAVTVVQVSFDEQHGFAPTLTVTRHAPATGTPLGSTVIDVADPEAVLDTGLFCRDWLTASMLACGRSGGAPVAIADDGSFRELAGPAGAMPSIVGRPVA